MKRKILVVLMVCLVVTGILSYAGIVEEINFHWQEKEKAVRTLTDSDVFYVSFNDIASLLDVELSIRNSEIFLAPSANRAETIVESNGDVYIGKIYAGKYHGPGVLHTRNGMKLEGIFVEGHLEGEGTLVYVNGDVYMGNFMYGLPHGTGEKKLSNGDNYVGAFEYGIITGQGKMKYANKDVYTGQFTNGIYDGYGIFHDFDGSTKQGLWELGRYTRYIATDEINRILNK